MILALDALNRMKQGNRRFISGDSELDPHVTKNQLDKLVSGQEPIAVVLGCSDSRVPVEVIFDQGIGDLFVIRVAGNVAGPTQIGSVEFAVNQLGVRLVVVLGHTGCGAVRAALDKLHQPSEGSSPALNSILDHIQPALEGYLAADLDNNPLDVERKAIRANIRTSIARLHEHSDMLYRLIQTEGLLVIGAEYSLDTGAVEFLEGLPESG